MNRAWLLFAGAVLAPGIAAAVCLDPRNPDISGYHIPLDDEIRSSVAIAVGKVVEERKLRDVPNDPENVLATIYTVRVERVLKGRLPRIIQLRSEMDSGRYAMEVGERHVVFLEPLRLAQGDGYSASNCGNSAMLPAGAKVVRQVQARIK